MYNNSATDYGWSGPLYTYDGTHPSPIGRELVGNFIAKQISSHYFNKPATDKDEKLRTQQSTTRLILLMLTWIPSMGSCYPTGTIQVAQGEDLVVSITAQTGYKISTVIVDGTTLNEPGNTYTFENVSANHSIHVEFESEVVGTTLPVISQVTTPTSEVENSTYTGQYFAYSGIRNTHSLQVLDDT